MPRSARSIIACPTAWRVEPGSVVVAPLGPAPAARRRVGGRAAADQRSAGQPAAAAGRPARRPADRRAAAAAGRMDRGLLPRAARFGAADGAAVVGALDGPASSSNIARPAVPERLTPQREKALAALEGRQGTIRELADHAGVSDGVMRGLVNAGALEPSRSMPTGPRLPRSRFRAARAQRRPARGRRQPRVGDRQGLRPGPARRRHRLGQDRSLFRSDRRVPAPGRQALVLLPEIALTEPFLKRFEARFGCPPVAWHSPALVAAPPRLARHRQRRREGHRRRALGAVPALPQARPDRRRRGARAELQAGGRSPVPRPRHGGDARASSRTSR